MLYVIGIIGFIGGFVAGIGLIHFLLRNVSVEELQNDPYYKYKYGLLTWLVAALGAYSAVETYQRYFF